MMPPKRTRPKKSVKEEVDDLPSMCTLKDRRVDADTLFAPILHPAAVEFGELLNQNLSWIYEGKEDLKRICEDFGGSKAVPKTPKRETAFSKIKDTISMFDNLALTHVPVPQQLRKLVLNNDVDDEDDIPDEVFEQETQNEATERVIKTDNSPDVRSATPKNAREIKEEILSEEREEVAVVPRKGRSRTAKTSAVVPQTTRAVTSSTREPRDVEMRDESAERRPRPLPPQTRIHTPNRIRMGVKSPARAVGTPTRDNAAARVQTLKKPITRVIVNESHSSSNSSPSKNVKIAPKLNVNTKEAERLREEALRKFEEKGKKAEAAKEEAVKERADRVRKEREEREMKARANREEEEKKKEMERQKNKEKEMRAAELRKRQAQSPGRGGRDRGDRGDRGEERPRTPSRVRLAKSPEGRLMKRVMESPLTPRVPIKQHRINSVKRDAKNRMESSEDDDMDREARHVMKMKEERKKREEEEAARLRAVKEEEERVARMKEEERRRDEERKRKEREEKERKEREKKEREERERRMREEEEKRLKTPVLKNKHLLNASMNESQNSYDMTPDKIHIPATETNYGVDDLDSGDETDNEDNPRKKVPKWASQPQLSRTIALIRHSPPFDPDVFFGPIIEPDLNVIFKPSSKYPKRTSSAKWDSPLSNPTRGKSRFLNQ